MIELSPVFQTIFSSQLLLALLVAIAIIPLLRRPAVRINLIDHPGGRKQHAAPVPLTGGPAIFIALAASMFIWGIPEGLQGVAFAASGLFLIGFLDDLHDISAKLRLAIQTTLVITALWWDNIWLADIVLTENYSFALGYFKYPITIIAILGIMNAINMLDGLDGLSSGIVLIILGFLTGLSVIAGATQISLMTTCLFGSVLGFWAYNYRFPWREKAPFFMGDSGTNLLGFVLPVLAIKLSIVVPNHMPQTTLLWLFAVPIWDICAVVIKRLRDGKSPLEAGRDHIHHVLMNTGLSVRHSLHIIYLLTIATVSFGVSLQYLGFGVLETYTTFLVFMTFHLARVGSLYRKTHDKVYDFETMPDRRENDLVKGNKIVKIGRRK